jgi:glucokinase
MDVKLGRELQSPSMLLAGDVGGTKTLVGLFAGGAPRPQCVQTESFRTLEFSDLPSLVSAFLRTCSRDAREIDSACFGVSGPVKDGCARLTNVPWMVDARVIGRELRVRRADVINDLEALAWSVPVLYRSEIDVLSEGEPDAGGAVALIAAGTGLGVALLPKVGGRLAPVPSEGGHADFAARNKAEETLRAALTQELGRADLEQVLSGPGLANIYRHVYPHQCATVSRDAHAEELPRLISEAALEGQCPQCRNALEMFVGVYGAAAGNLALTALATGGLFLGGGIAPRILEALHWPVFLEAFWSKAPLEGLMRKIPVSVILNPEAGLVGAATFAATHAGKGQ